MRIRSAVWLALLAVAACSGGGDPSPTTGTIAVHNASTHPLDRVYAEPSPASVFSTQRNGAQVAPGETFAITGLAPGDWDCLIVVVDQGTRFWAPLDAVAVGAGDLVPFTIRDESFYARLEVTNAGGTDITGVFLYDGGWGPSLIENSGPIAPGTVQIPPWHLFAGTYDLRCDFAGGGSSTGSIVLQSLVLTRVTCPFP